MVCRRRRAGRPRRGIRGRIPRNRRRRHPCRRPDPVRLDVVRAARPDRRTRARRRKTAASTILAAALMLCTLSAYLSELFGLHAVFGACLIGTAMPRGVVAERIRKPLEPFTLVFLLPVFFTYSGLHTQLAMVNTPRLLFIALGILAASIFAKFV